MNITRRIAIFLCVGFGIAATLVRPCPIVDQGSSSSTDSADKPDWILSDEDVAWLDAYLNDPDYVTNGGL